MVANVYAQLGKAIRRRRDGLGLSQAQLGERSGLGRTSITMIERGAQAILVHQLMDIAAALRVDPGAMLREVTLEREAPEPSDVSTEFEILLTGLQKPITRITR